MDGLDPFEPSSFRNRLNSRLLDARTVVLNEAVTERVAGQLTEQLTVLDAESTDPIEVLINNAPGGDVEAALSVYDLLRALSAPVTILAGGRVAGAAVVAFLGGPASRRFALPHVRFWLELPGASLTGETADDIGARAETARDRRARVVEVMAAATGQSEQQVEADLSDRRAFEGEDAQDYGLVERVVQSRREVF
ncbi:MAG: ATP-dependent Clp protease proteolytic subunit [Salinivenus sp.]